MGTEIMIGMLAGAGSSLLAASILTMIKRINKSRQTEEDIKNVREELKELKEGQHVLFKLILPLLINVRDGKTNGELKEALHLYNEYMCEK